MLSFSTNNLQYYLLDANVLSENLFYNYIYTPWCLIIPILLFFYVTQSLHPDRKITWQHKLLFIPFLIGLLLSVLYKILIAFQYKNDAIYDFFSYIPSLIEFTAIFLNLSVLINLLLKIKQFEKENNEVTLDKIKIRLNWLRQILLYLLALTLLWLYLMFLVVSSYSKIGFYPLWIGISVLTYWLGHFGIYKFGIIEERKNLKKYAKEISATYSIVEKQKSNHIIALENLIIDQKRYLDSDLTLDKIAEELHLSKSYLSRVINAELGIGFVDYVNTFRVEEAKKYILNSEFSNYTLVSIGIEAGFNSKSAFYSSFKKITGQTPTEFKKEITNLS